MKPIIVLKSWLAHRARKRDCTLLVMHSTAGSSNPISWLRQIGLSYHYIIEKNGQVTKCVPASRVAFHAGKSVGPGGPNCNDYSVGISFVNKNDGKDPLTLEQIVAAQELAIELKGQLPLVWAACHFGVSPGRKFDPKLFDLKAFAAVVGLKPWKADGAPWRMF